jgi:hypothetical protein
MSVTSNAEPSVRACLESFRTLVNGHARVRKLIKGWEPVVFVEPTDLDERYYLHVRSSEITQITASCDSEPEHLVHVRGPTRELTAVFSGRKSAARAVLDADLEVFAIDRDQVKLDAISMILWGV